MFKPFTVGAVLAHKNQRKNQRNKKMTEVKKWMGSKPERCDICSKEFDEIFIDGQTIIGKWGLLCRTCHKNYGAGLGTGRGQKYDLETLIKLEG